MINSKLLAFATGVALTALLHLGALWANNKRWESEMVNHGWGYWKWSIYDKMDWDGNQPLKPTGITSPNQQKEPLDARFGCESSAKTTGLKQAPKPQADPPGAAEVTGAGWRAVKWLTTYG
jgi:hypothetical protein